MCAAWRAGRDQAAVDAALAELRRVASSTENVMPATLALARAGGTTGEWGAVMREVFGEYRGPTGVGGAGATTTRGLAEVAARVRALPGGPRATAGRQARPRRALQRRRADRRRRP